MGQAPTTTGDASSNPKYFARVFTAMINDHLLSVLRLEIQGGDTRPTLKSI